jgi:uncharacterized protein YndB with AHSA1/START domain
MDADAMKMSTLTTPTDTTIHIERTFDAPRECVWRAFTDSDLICRWWGRGHDVDVVRNEVARGGHWRFVEHIPDGITAGFEGRFREVAPLEHMSQTFEWDGMPGYVSVQTATFDDLGDGRTNVLTDVLFFTPEERDSMLGSGMQGGLDESYAALDRLLATIC